MKKLFTLIAVLIGLQSVAQNIPPQAINFQGVAIDKNGIPVPGMDELGNPIQNSGIKVRFSILEGNATGTLVYREVHETTTDEFGRFNVEIGRGSNQEGLFGSIQWGNDRHFLKVEVDLKDSGTNYTLESVQEFLSVPYALYSMNSGSSSDDLDKDDQNEIQALTLSGDLLSISRGNTVMLPADLDEQLLSISGQVVSISNGNSIVLPLDSDNQTLSVSGTNLSIANGNTVTIPVSPDNQTLSISGNTLNISNGNSVSLPTDSDNQSLSISSSGNNRTISITGGNSVSFRVSDSDSSATNELQTITKTNDLISLSNNGGSVLDSDNQTLSLSGTTLAISGGNSIVIPDAQTLTLAGNSLSISNGNTVNLPADSDNQTLSLTGSNLTISGGNTINLPTGSDSQTLSISGNQLSISNGNNINLPTSIDNDTTNELQSFSLRGDSVFLSKSNSYFLLNQTSNSQNGNYLRSSVYSGSSTGTSTGGNTVIVDTVNLNAGDWIRIDNSMSRSGNCGGGDGQLWVETNFGQLIGYSSRGLNIGYNGYNAPQYAPNGIVYFTVSQNCTISIKFKITGGNCSGSTDGIVAVFRGSSSYPNANTQPNLSNLILTIDGF